MGYEVPQAVFDALCNRLDKGPAEAFLLVQTAVDAGATTKGYIAHRVVDRWLQKQRKDGRIQFVKRRWQIARPTSTRTPPP